MSARKALWVCAAAAAALTLTACNSHSTTGPSPAVTVTVTPGGPMDTAGASSAAPGTQPATSKAAPAPTGAAPAALNQRAKDCKPGEGPAGKPGHKVVVVTKPVSGSTVHAKDGEYDCQMPDQGWWPKGDEKTYTIAAAATAQLAHDGEPKTVTLARLADHTAKCLSDSKQDPDSSCDSGVDYDLTLNAAGQITAISEVWGN